MTPLFDTHCHLQDPAFAGDAGPVLERAEAAGVAGMLLCGYDPPSNHAALEMAANSPLLLPAVGYHPHEAKDITPELLVELESLAALPAVVCVGEIGLDFFRDHSPRETQARIFAAQLEIASRVGKPVSVHTRGAEDASYDHLVRFSAARRWKTGMPPVGVMHCFGGTLDQAQAYSAIGFAISFACPVTYPGNERARTMAAAIPLESIVVETDSPYLPPQSLRGQRNEPANVRSAVAAIAAARGSSEHAVAEATTNNAARLFGVRLAVGVGPS